jgi:hypothetical protein
MNKSWLILQVVLILVLSQNMMAQTYSLKISTPEDERVMGSIEDENSGLYALIWRGVYNPDITPTTLYFNYRNIIYNIDRAGALVDSLQIDTLNGYDLALWNFIKAGDSLLVWGNAYNLENADVHLALLWLDFNLQIIDLSLYGNYTDSVEFINYTPVNDGNLVFAGGNSFTNELILVKTSGTGEFIKEGIIPGMAGPMPNIGYIPATNKIICGRDNWIGYVNNYDLTEDTAYYPLSFPFMSFGFYKTFDNSHVILPVQYHKIPPEYGRNICCMVIDTIAQMTDSLIFEMQPELNMEIEVDYINPDTLLLGAISNSYFEPPDLPFSHQDRKFALFKFNFDKGIFWENYYGDHANYVLLDITATSDGGCALLGAYYDWRNNPVLERDVVIFKIDSEGLFTNIPEDKNENVQLFPNPASDKIMIEFSQKEQFNLKKKTIQIYNLLGNEILDTEGIADHEIIINVAGFPPGIYFFRIMSGNDLQFNQKVIVR